MSLPDLQKAMQAANTAMIESYQKLHLVIGSEGVTAQAIQDAKKAHADATEAFTAASNAFNAALAAHTV